MAKKPDFPSLTALITGGAGGIGLEFAKSLASAGTSLILLDINAENLNKAAETIESIYPPHLKKKPFILPVDLTSENLLEILDGFCSRHNLIPDILVNNAGIFSFKPIADTDSRKIETFIDLHVRAVTLLSKWFVEKREPLGSGWMLNMSSMSCWMPMPGLAMYASTKSYIRVFSSSLHYEMKPFGVGVTVACPGGIATDLFGLPQKWKNFAVTIGVLDTPEKFASKAIKKMMKKRRVYINGWLNRFSIFFVGILPSRIRMMVKSHLLDKGITR